MKSAGATSDPIVQRPGNAVFRQIARGSELPIGPVLGVKTAAAQLLELLRVLGANLPTGSRSPQETP